MPFEGFRADELNRNINPISDCKEAIEISAKDRFGRGTFPISIKYKKLGNDESMSRQREHHRNDGFLHELGKSTRERPPLEIGPKRLKIRGPTYLGSESTGLKL